MTERMRGSLLLLPVLLVAATPSAHAGDPSQCRILEADFTPTADLQLVVWLEKADGTFLDTLFITAATGSYGLGNRPGMMTFNSSWAWPYGRRTSTFPVWAHRHGRSWPEIVFQDGHDDNLSHDGDQSSHE